MHEYTVELRIYGKELDVSKVTEYVGLQPSSLRRAGEAAGSRQMEYSLWGYDGREDDANPKTWDSLEDGLLFLLGRLSNVKDKIGEYVPKYNVIFWCGHFQSGFDGGPTLSPALLRRLGEFGVGLFIDNYFSVEGHDENGLLSKL